MNDLSHFHDNSDGSIIICEPQNEYEWIKSDYYVEL